MNGIIELEDRHAENTYVGRKNDIIRFMQEQLGEYFDGIPDAEDLDYDHLSIIRDTSDAIMQIMTGAKEDDIVMVDNVLFDYTKWYIADIVAR